MATHMKQHAESVPNQNTQPTSEPAATDAIALLKADHRLVEDLFSRYESASSQERKKIVSTICQELTVHASLEENFFYPQVRAQLKDEKDLLDEALVEHSSLKWLIAQLEIESPDADLYDAKVTVLKEYVEHHVKEEEKELFPKVRKSDLDLVALGHTLVEAKQVLQKELRH